MAQTPIFTSLPLQSTTDSAIAIKVSCSIYLYTVFNYIALTVHLIFIEVFYFFCQIARYHPMDPLLLFVGACVMIVPGNQMRQS